MKGGVKKMSTCGILKTKKGMIVIYWPSTEPSIKRYTCVNKRKNSRSRWTIENNITRCPGGSSQLETGCRSENQLLWVLSDHRLSNPSQDAKKCCYGREMRKSVAMVERGTWVNIAVRPCLHLFLTHNKHHLFENKVWEIYIFIKKCIRSLLKSSLSVDYVPVYICIRAVVLWIYNSWMRWLYLYKVVRPLNSTSECPGYDIKPSDGEVPVLELWEISITPLLPLFPGPLLHRVVVPVTVPYMGQIELSNYLLYLKTFNSVETKD